MTIRFSHLAKNQRSSTAVTPASPQHHSLACTCSAPALSSSPFKAPLLLFAPPVIVTGPEVRSCSLLHRCRQNKTCRKAHGHRRVTQARTPLMHYYSASGIQLTNRSLRVLAYFTFKIYSIYFYFLQETRGTVVVRWFLLLLPCFLHCSVCKELDS